MAEHWEGCLVLQITISKRAAVVIALALILVIPGVAGATHVFLDVGDGDTHAEGIEWMADAGVSVGCGDGTNYCPDDDVSRAQMGTFMYRLSGNDPATDPSVNAATLEGYGATGLWSAVGTLSLGHASFVTLNTAEVGHTFTVTAPADGYLQVSLAGQVYIDVDTATDDSEYGAGTFGLCTAPDTVSTTNCHRAHIWDVDPDDTHGYNSEYGITLTMTIPVTAGDYTFYVNGQPEHAASSAELNNVNISAVFTSHELAMVDDS